ncbi:MAG: hypothetical protein ABI681_09000 [Gemmatimonadales bacterium]
MAFERIGIAIYVIDAAAMSSAHFFDNPGLKFGAALSPDGRRVAYTSYDNATLYDVFVANLDGTGTQHVTRFPQQQGPPTWSPDGAKIVVAGRTGNSIVYDVYSQSPVTNPSDQTQLTHFIATPDSPITCPVIIDNRDRVVASTQGMLAFACSAGEIDVLSSGGNTVGVLQAGARRRSTLAQRLLTILVP